MSSTLTDLFRAKKAEADAHANDASQSERLGAWLTAIGHLYADIRLWLAEPIAQNLVSVERRERNVDEPLHGHYVVADLILDVGDERVVFAPNGRAVAGARGRVDVRGESGEAMLVLFPGDRWSVVKQRVPAFRAEPLDRSSFAELVAAVMRQ